MEMTSLIGFSALKGPFGGRFSDPEASPMSWTWPPRRFVWILTSADEDPDTERIALMSYRLGFYIALLTLAEFLASGDLRYIVGDQRPPYTFSHVPTIGVA